MAGFQNSVMVAKNMNFDEVGAKPLLGIINAAGKLPIGTGNTAPTPEILGGSITSPDSSITVGYSSPNITLTVASPGAQSIAGDTGTITGTVLIIFANNTANNSGASVKFVNSGTTSTFNLTDANKNTSLGKNCGKLGQTYLALTAVGYNCAPALTTGNDNTVMGQNCGLTLTTGNGNTAIGSAALAQVTTGSNNTCLGTLAGQTMTGSDSSNICIKNVGVSGDNNTIRIGTQGSGAGQQNKCYVAGITGVTVSNEQLVTIDSSTGQMGVVVPARFMAYVNTSILNVTGDGTEYKVIFDTEVFDVGSNFNLGTSTFTAPVTGQYFLQFACLVTGGTNIGGANARIVTSNRTYNQSMNQAVGGSTASTNVTMSVVADMDAGDTATFTILTSDTGGKIDDISGTTSGNLRTYCSGYQIV